MKMDVTQDEMKKVARELKKCENWKRSRSDDFFIIESPRPGAFYGKFCTTDKATFYRDPNAEITKVWFHDKK